MTELDLHIDPEFEAYLEAPDQIPEADLLTAIREAGNQCLDTIKVWGQNGKATILDGHRRYRLAEKHPEIRYTVESIDLPDRSAAYRWIYVYQFSRRNKVPTAAEIQAFRGRWYNAAKKDKATNLPLPKGQIDPLGETLQKQGSTAKSIAEQTGVSESTIKRDGARIKALEKCTDAIQKGINSGTIKATDAQIKTLAGLKPAAKQDAIAKDCRNGATLAKAMAKEKVKPPAQKKKAKPPRKLDRAGYYKQWTAAMKPLVSLADKIADGVGEVDCQSHETIQGQLEAATEEMMEWLGVER